MKFNYIILNFFMLILPYFGIFPLNEYENYIKSVVDSINFSITETSLEKLKYIRHGLYEFVDKNKESIETANVLPSLKQLNAYIQHYEKIVKECKLGNYDSEPSAALHPLKAKFIGKTLFKDDDFNRLIDKKDESKLREIKELCSNSVIELSYLKKIYDVTNTAILTPKEEDHLNTLCRYLTVTELGGSIDNLSNVLQIVVRCVEKYKGTEKEKEMYQHACKKLKPHLNNENFVWDEKKYKNFMEDPNNIIDSINIVNYLKGKYNNDQYSLALKILSKLQTKPSDNIKQIQDELLRLFQKDLSDPILKGHIDNMTTARNGIPSMFQGLISGLPNAHGSEDRIALGNMITTLSVRDKEELYFMMEKSLSENWKRPEDVICKVPNKELNEKNKVTLDADEQLVRHRNRPDATKGRLDSEKKLEERLNILNDYLNSNIEPRDLGDENPLRKEFMRKGILEENFRKDKMNEADIIKKQLDKLRKEKTQNKNS